MQKNNNNPQLPAFIRPMLAQSGAPFDSREHLFEIKWDGIRLLAFVDGTGPRLLSRHRQELTECFPELSFWERLPPGTVLDGELVVLQNGRPNLGLIQGRQQLRDRQKILIRSKTTPAAYLVFDQPYCRYRSLCSQPLAVRREMLQTTVRQCGHPRLVFSAGIIGAGKLLYQEAIRQRLEGVMAKRLGSLYRPGSRSEAWLKIKPPAGESKSLNPGGPCS